MASIDPAHCLDVKEDGHDVIDQVGEHRGSEAERPHEVGESEQECLQHIGFPKMTKKASETVRSRPRETTLGRSARDTEDKAVFISFSFRDMNIYRICDWLLLVMRPGTVFRCDLRR